MVRGAGSTDSPGRRTSAALQLSLFDDPPGSGAAPFVPPPTPVPVAPAPSLPRTPAPAPVAPVGGDWPRHPRADRHIVLDRVRVDYWLRRTRRRSIGFSVGPEGLVVAAPRWVGLGDIEQALQAKARWIVGKLHEQAERARHTAAARIDWADGATFPFLGEPVIVRLRPHGTGAVLQAETEGPRELHLGLPADAQPQQIRDAVQSWLQRQAIRLFEERCRDYAARLGVRVRRLGLTSARTRWGSASADGSIRLNWRLVHFRLPTIDYVVAHELAHLREMNHSPAFWDVVRSVVPDYEAAMSPLKREVVPLV